MRPSTSRTCRGWTESGHSDQSSSGLQGFFRFRRTICLHWPQPRTGIWRPLRLSAAASESERRDGKEQRPRAAQRRFAHRVLNRVGVSRDLHDPAVALHLHARAGALLDLLDGRSTLTCDGDENQSNQTLRNVFLTDMILRVDEDRSVAAERSRLGQGQGGWSRRVRGIGGFAQRSRRGAGAAVLRGCVARR